tara:strand:+ start:1345 stop:1998 length:654 start_codon:yes stop_codon:yes gene_type:complete
MFKIGMFIVGIAVIFYGFSEFRLSKAASDEPTTLELAEIESGTADLSNAHVVIGPHVADYYECIFEYEGGNEMKDTDKVTYAYYPILSSQHPYVVGMNRLYEQHPEGIPEEIPLPDMGVISVLVKTEQFPTIADIPEDMILEKQVQGLFVNKIEKLDKDEIDLLKDSYPAIDPEKVLLLDKARTPTPAGITFGIMGGGALVCVFAILWMVLPGRRQA